MSTALRKSVLIVAPLDLTVSGNSTTARRLEHILAPSFDVTVQNFNLPKEGVVTKGLAALPVSPLPPTFKYDVVIGLHALRTAKWLLANEGQFLFDAVGHELPPVPGDIDFDKSEIVAPRAPRMTPPGLAAMNKTGGGESPDPPPPRLHRNAAAAAASNTGDEESKLHHHPQQHQSLQQMRAAQVFRQSGQQLRPFVLIFGGTDVNENAKNPQQVQLMQIAVDRAVKCVCFSSAVLNAARSAFPSTPEKKFVVIPQTVDEKIWSLCHRLLHEMAFAGKIVKPILYDSDRQSIHDDHPLRHENGPVGAWVDDPSDGTRYYWSPQDESEMDRVLREAQPPQQQQQQTKDGKGRKKHRELSPEYEQVFSRLRERSRSRQSVTTTSDDDDHVADEGDNNKSQEDDDAPFYSGSARRWIVMPAGVRPVKNQAPVIEMLVELNRMAMRKEIEEFDAEVNQQQLQHQKSPHGDDEDDAVDDAEVQLEKSFKLFMADLAQPVQTGAAADPAKFRQEQEHPSNKQQQDDSVQKTTSGSRSSPKKHEEKLVAAYAADPTAFKHFMCDLAKPVQTSTAADPGKFLQKGAEGAEDGGTSSSCSRSDDDDDDDDDDEYEDSCVAEWGLLLLGPVIDEEYVCFIECVLAWAREFHRTNAVIVWHRQGISAERLTTLLFDRNSRISLVLNASLSEGQPQAIMEAMAVTSVHRKEELQREMFQLPKTVETAPKSESKKKTKKNEQQQADPLTVELSEGFLCAVSDCPGNLAVADSSCAIVLPLSETPSRWAANVHSQFLGSASACSPALAALRRMKRDAAAKRADETMQPMQEALRWNTLLSEEV